MFDLTVFPLSIEAGHEQYELPGLLVAAAPRKASRLRSQDQLLLYWSSTSRPSGKGALSPAQQQEILARLAETYYTSSGSVTAGLRAVVSRLNDFLFNRNLKTAHEGQWVSTLNLAVVHNATLMLAHGGPTHSFVLARSQVLHFSDTQSVRGLGLSRQVMPRFYQADLQSGDLLMVSSQPPQAWTEKTLTSGPQLSLDHLRRRLVSESDGSLQAVLMRFQEGKGQISYWKPSERRSARTAADGSRAPAQPPAQAPAEKSIQPGSLNAGIPVPERGVSEPDPQASAVEQNNLETAAPPIEKVVIGGDAAFAAGDGVGERLEQNAGTGAEQIDSFAQPRQTGENGYDDTNSAQNSLPGGPAEVEPAPPNAVPTGDVNRLTPPWEDLPGPAPGNGSTPYESAERPRDAVFINDSAPAASPSTGAPADGGHSLSGAAGAATDQPISPRPRPSGLHWRSHAGPARPTAAEPGSPAPASATVATTVEAAAAAAPAKESQSLRQRVRERAAPRVSQPKARPAGPPRPNPLKVWLASVWQKSSTARARAARVTTRILPQRKEPLIQIPASVLLLISIAVPLIVVAVATTVYLETGREEQYQILFARAQQYAQTAESQTDPIQQRDNWNQVYKLVRDAEGYQRTEESNALKLRALTILDELEGFVRLNYQPVIQGGLGSDVNITRMVSTPTGVYLLDSGNGSILHLMNTTNGFDLNANFRCGTGKAGSVIVGKLVDLAPLPLNNEMRAAVVGIDESGTLVYCTTGKEGFSASPLAMPDAGWGEIKAMTSLGNILYILDPKNNAVYWYDGQNGIFSSKPHLFFDASVPKMDNVVDIAVDQDYLYMLHDDGTMTLCESSGFAFVPTKCTDPITYGDGRPGREPTPLVFVDSQLVQLQTTQPPDPSLYALDALNKGIYHLSLRRLNLQRQYRPFPDSDFPLPNRAPSAFAVTQNRRVLMAFGNEVYFAPIE